LYRTGPPAAAIVTILALASCGGGSSTAGTTNASEGSNAKVAASPTKCVRSNDRYAAKSANACPGGAGPAAAGGGCQQQLGEFVGRMSDLRQALLAGLSYSEYVVRVQAIRDAYEAVPVKKLGASCLNGPASDAENALNQYLRAANAWGECAGTAGCAASEIEGKLQHRWRIASKSLDEAKKG
jgi:hypothetical protein